MSTINIAGLTPVEDPSYRYKMPKVMGKVEGRGNGIKTVLINITDVAASLNREAPEITKFFGCELGSQTTYAADTDRAIVNGAHRDMDLQNHMSRYIENFVLCKNCRLPETHYKIKDGMISQKCLACGSKDAVDMTHKLTAFILAQHKKSKEAAKGVDKKDKEKKKADKKSSKKEDSADTNGATETTNSDKKEKEKDKKSSKKKSKEGGSSNSAESSSANSTTVNKTDSEDQEEDESDSKAAGKY